MLSNIDFAPEYTQVCEYANDAAWQIDLRVRSYVVFVHTPLPSAFRRKWTRSLH